MRAGKLDQRIILQSLTETSEQGSLIPTYTTEDTVWAEVITERGTEAFQAARINARATIRVRIRYREDVTTKWRIDWEGQKYNITAVDRSMRRKGELWFTAECVGVA